MDEELKERLALLLVAVGVVVLVLAILLLTLGRLAYRGGNEQQQPLLPRHHNH